MGAIAQLCYGLEVFWVIKKCLKGVSKHFFCIYPNRYGLDLSKEVLYVHFGQEGSKLQILKVGACEIGFVRLIIVLPDC